MNRINIPEDKEHILLLCTFRYALGRTSYIVSDVAKWLMDNKHVFPRFLQVQIYEDIINALNQDRAGHECDRRSWKEVAKHYRWEEAK